MNLFLSFLLCPLLHADTPTPLPTSSHKHPTLHYDRAANQALHDKFEAKRHTGKNAVLVDMRKQLEALGNPGSGSVDLTYWKAHEREVVGSFRGDQRRAVLEFYQTLEQYGADGSAATDTKVKAKARMRAAPDKAKVKAALEKRLSQVGLEKAMISN
jgi:hypothetical protein